MMKRICMFGALLLTLGDACGIEAIREKKIEAAYKELEGKFLDVCPKFADGLTPYLKSGLSVSHDERTRYTIASIEEKLKTSVLGDNTLANDRPVLFRIDTRKLQNALKDDYDFRMAIFWTGIRAVIGRLSIMLKSTNECVFSSGPINGDWVTEKRRGSLCDYLLEVDESERNGPQQER
ncbi:hypothetical protein FACS189449_08700 [Alphaproteobacteria bacterium]|nr:hypothetical protein FACS189449_08700 [Alphaproteobacteria bacterium]